MMAALFFLYIPSLLGIVFGIAVTIAFITHGKKRIAALLLSVGCVFVFHYLATTLLDSLDEPVMETVPTKSTTTWI